LLTLNYRDSRPIYGQIKDGLRRLIVTGALEPDEKLPSVRSMAMDLAINPNTIQRAYAELEAEGFIYSVPGKGSFAARRLGAGEAHAARRAALMERLRELIAELRYLNVTDGEIIALMNEGVAQ
jgi:GntR family transcriptional regulator